MKEKQKFDGTGNPFFLEGGGAEKLVDRKVFWAEQIVSSFSRVGKVGEAGEQLKLKNMVDG